MSEPPDGIPSGQDEIDRRLREITSGLAGEAKFKEPSAAERARKPVQPAEVKRLGWRATRKARKLREPVTGSGQPAPKYWRVAAGGRASAGRRQSAPRPVPQRAGLRQLLARRAVILLAFCGLLYGLHVLGFGPQAASSPQNPTTPTPKAAGSGSPSPRHGSGPAFTIADPFAGSPAEGFVDGAAGIVLPAAQPVGGYSAAQVAAAYVVTRKMLIAADLDPGTLRGGSPVAFARLLTASERSDFTGGLDLTGVNASGHAESTRGWVTSFAPGTQFVGSLIAVHGMMSALTARHSGRDVLRVHADYLFVYPVQRPGLPLTRMRVVTRVAVNVDFAQWTDPGGPLQPWWQPIGGGPAGIQCGIYDGFVHPQFPGSQPGPVLPSGIPIDPYDQRTPPSHAGCVAVTRT